MISKNKDLKYLIGALSEIESVLLKEGETGLMLFGVQRFSFGRILKFNAYDLEQED
ncbi:MAG: hypothetical protein KAI83_06055 [Thiomargarita sp.]|nr:hypothetical protein [Thiomargarita sp.]